MPDGLAGKKLLELVWMEQSFLVTAVRKDFLGFLSPEHCPLSLTYKVSETPVPLGRSSLLRTCEVHELPSSPT